MKGSKQELRYTDNEGKKTLPHVWETSIGLDRTFYAIIENSLNMDEKRTYLSLPITLAPVQFSVFPLLSNKQELKDEAKKIYDEFKDCYDIAYDSSGSIGKRYARVDEIGCPYCITIDFDSLENKDVTIRERDTAEQKRIKQEELKEVLFKLMTGSTLKDI